MDGHPRENAVVMSCVPNLRRWRGWELMKPPLGSHRRERSMPNLPCRRAFGLESLENVLHHIVSRAGSADSSAEATVTGMM